MTTVMIHHRVADYDRWKIEYDRIFEGPLSAAVTSYRIWRGQDDPGLVILEETYESRDAAGHDRATGRERGGRLDGAIRHGF
jgi:hypothetical protein